MTLVSEYNDSGGFIKMVDSNNQVSDMNQER